MFWKQTATLSFMLDISVVSLQVIHRIKNNMHSRFHTCICVTSNLWNVYKCHKLFATQKLEELENELASDSRKPPSGRGDDVAAPAGARAVLGELPGTKQA